MYCITVLAYSSTSKFIMDIKLICFENTWTIYWKYMYYNYIRQKALPPSHSIPPPKKKLYTSEMVWDLGLGS